MEKENKKQVENTDNSTEKLLLSDVMVSCIWKPTNQLRWYTKYNNTYPKQKLQQMWISESGETKWENVPEESGN